MIDQGISVKVFELIKTFNQGKVIALDRINLNFSSGMLHGIIGPAGAGKTTLLRTLLNLMKIDSGKIEYYLNKKLVTFKDVMSKIAYMPQQQSLYADLTIKEHLKFFANLYGIDKETYQQKTKELLAVTRLGDFLNRPAKKLSGGMYKKLGLMCTLLRAPNLILLDEPTNGVDPISRREFWEILNDAIKQNITVIMTTAYMDEAERCTKVHLMEEGKLIGHGEPVKLLETEQVTNFDDFFIKRSTKPKSKT